MSVDDPVNASCTPGDRPTPSGRLTSADLARFHQLNYAESSERAALVREAAETMRMLFVNDAVVTEDAPVLVGPP